MNLLLWFGVIVFTVFGLYKLTELRMARAVLGAHIRAAMNLAPEEFSVNYHSKKPIYGIDTVMQYKGHKDVDVTFVFEQRDVIKILVNDKHCMALHKTLNIVREDSLYNELTKMKNKLLAEEK